MRRVPTSAGLLAVLVLVACRKARSDPASKTPDSPVATATVPEAAATAPEDSPPPPATKPTPQEEPDHRQPPETSTNAFGDRVPVHFDIEGMLEAALPSRWRAGAEARILSWLIQIDERPLLVEQVLLWIMVAPKNAAPSYRLVNLFRHPVGGWSGNKRWRLWMRSRSPPGLQSFAAPPTLAELDKFTSRTDWDYDASSGFDLVDGQVCAGAWKRSFGTPPKHSFP